MKSLNSSFCLRTGLALVLAALLNPALHAVEPVDATARTGDKAADKTADKIEDYRASSSEMNKAEVKAALASIDAELKHLDALADAAPTPELQADAKARYRGLKERRNELKREFTRARYDAFKADLRMESEKAAAWAKETFATKPAATSSAAATSAAADATAEKIAGFRTEPTDINKAEARAALERLDADIGLLDAKIDALSDPVRKAELQQRLKEFKQRRSELNSEFRKARFDALAADVKDQWNRLMH